jgi:hypothetical protein
VAWEVTSGAPKIGGATVRIDFLTVHGDLLPFIALSKLGGFNNSLIKASRRQLASSRQLAEMCFVLAGLAWQSYRKKMTMCQACNSRRDVPVDLGAEIQRTGYGWGLMTCFDYGVHMCLFN